MGNQKEISPAKGDELYNSSYSHKHFYAVGYLIAVHCAWHIQTRTAVPRDGGIKPSSQLGFCARSRTLLNTNLASVVSLPCFSSYISLPGRFCGAVIPFASTCLIFS